MTAVRRSGRSRRQAHTVYDDAKEAALEEEQSSDSNDEKDNDTEVESVVNEETDDDDDNKSSSEEEEEEEEEKTKKRATKGAASSTNRSSNKKRVEMAPNQTAANPFKIKSKPNPKQRTRTRTATSSSANGLAALARKVLEPDETPQTSLVAALLHSYKANARAPGPTTSENDETTTTTSNNHLLLFPSTLYTPQLEHIARMVLQEHSKNANTAQTNLLNLLFRSVGGSMQSNLAIPSLPSSSSSSSSSQQVLILEDMSHEQWGDVITSIVDEMRHTPADRVLLCADPNGAVHANLGLQKQNQNGSTPAATAIRTYRTIYQEFWYVLGKLAVSQESRSSSSNGGRVGGATRFPTEVANDVVNRIIELVSVGQPDVRAAATIASLQIGHALLDRTLVLQKKLDLAKRQFVAAGGTSNKKTKNKNQQPLTHKQESLHHQMDILQRSIQDLEEIVLGPIIQAVFMHRYRDSNPHIRATCLDSLSKMSMQRPELFLNNKYLKYFGWMLNDKAICVRVASVRALLAPFLRVKHLEQHGNHNNNNANTQIDLFAMEGILENFRERIVDCIMDVSTLVQEQAIALLLELLRQGFLDDQEDNAFWQKINILALQKNTSPLARRDALYFVMEQLEPFDQGDEEEEAVSDDESDDHEKRQKGKKAKWSKEKNTSLAQSSERMAALQLAALASWVAHALTDGPIPIEKIQVELSDFIVHSLRGMPEHKHLATNWSAMLLAISSDSPATKLDNNVDDSHRLDPAKERILVQILACAAHAEVGAVADTTFQSQEVDEDVATALATITPITLPAAAAEESKKPRANNKKSKTGIQHETLSVSLLNSLPKLLAKFKSDSSVLGSLSGLPRYLLPSVLSLPQRKNSCTALMKNLSEIYLESTDETVLCNIALSLTVLSKGDHARAPDARWQLERLSVALQDRAISLFQGKETEEPKKRKAAQPKASTKKRRRGRSSVSASSQSSQSTANLEDSEDDGEDDASKVDVEYAIYLCLKRLRVLSKRCNTAEFMESSSVAKNDDGIRTVCNAIVKGIHERLNDRKVTIEEAEIDEEEEKVIVPQVWKTSKKTNAHGVIAMSVDEALSFLLSAAAWKVHQVTKEDSVVVHDNDDENQKDDDNDESVQGHVLLHLRKQLVALLELCFEQFLPADGDPAEDERYSTEHNDFAAKVQVSASRTASDLRTLFPKEWADAASPLLRACALNDDGRLIGGSVRYLRSQEDKLRANAQKKQEGEDADIVNSLLLPLGRSLAGNWTHGNRREAGVALAHITGSGQLSSSLVGSMSRLLKKVEPVRLLEAHMASLRQSYEDWMDNEPDDLDEDRVPSDEEMAAFEAAERKHDEMFQALEQQAGRLSQSLGVGKLSDAKLIPAVLGFVKEGARFSFSNSETGDDDDLLLGGRLSFLIVLGRYVGWIRRNKEQQALMQLDLDQKEAELRAHEDFSEVHEDDLKALGEFRAALGLKDYSKTMMSSQSVVSDSEDHDMIMTSVDRSTKLRRRLSRSSSIGSMKSKMSAQSSLSPLYEEDATINSDEEESPSPVRRRRRGNRSMSIGSSMSQLTNDAKTQATIEEESDESSEGSVE